MASYKKKRGGLKAIPKTRQSKSLRGALKGLSAATGQVCKAYTPKAGDPGGRGASGRGWKNNVVIRCTKTGSGSRSSTIKRSKSSKVSKTGANAAGKSNFLVRRAGHGGAQSAAERRAYFRAYRLLKKRSPNKVPSDLSSSQWSKLLREVGGEASKAAIKAKRKKSLKGAPKKAKRSARKKSLKGVSKRRTTKRTARKAVKRRSTRRR